MRKPTSRRKFIKTASAITAGAMVGLPGRLYAEVETIGEFPSVAVVKEGSAAAMTRRAVEMLGGMGQYIKGGETVVVKPNIGWDRRPEQAANTNPEVVAETVKMCLEAGAKRVMVFDRTCNSAKRCYANSGIAEAAENAGAMVSHVVKAGFKRYDMPGNKFMKGWELYSPAIEADCIINVPVAKHHSLSELTLGMKNLMGLMGGERGEIHWKIHQYLPELAAFIKPALTIIDATRILTANGPQGGSLKDVEALNTIVASPDVASADAYATTLFGMKPTDIGHIVNGPDYGLGEIDIDKMKLQLETL